MGYHSCLIFIIQDVPTLFERVIGYPEANVDAYWYALAFFASVNPEPTNAVNKKLGVQVTFHKFTAACPVGPCEVSIRGLRSCALPTHLLGGWWTA
jgi:hypothetical protein